MILFLRDSSVKPIIEGHMVMIIYNTKQKVLVYVRPSQELLPNGER